MLILSQLAASVLLLIWAVRMVRTGVERAYGTTLKRIVRRASATRIGMAGAGLMLAVILQSSTAVALLVTGFAANGLIATTPGLAALLGADLGSALVVKVLSFDLSALIPFLIIAGVVLFLKFEAREVRQSGRIVLGIAFILLALQMIGEATGPLRSSAALPAVLRFLETDPVSAFVAAAALAWLLHSSVATLLVFITFAATGMLPVEIAVPLVLGANVGSGLIAVWLSRAQPAAIRRLPIGNLAFRATAALAALGLTQAFGLPLHRLGASEGAQLVNFHILFNLALLLLALPFVGLMDRLTVRLMPAPPPAATASRLDSILDRTVIALPRLALASATRELLRMGETVETMLRPIADLLDIGTPAEIDRVRRIDDEVNWRHSEIKLYIAEVNRGVLGQDEARRGIDLTDFAINLEHIGDIVAKTILPIAAGKVRHRLKFSSDGWSEICVLHDRVLANLQLALNVLVSGDLDSARRLVREKEAIRRLERESHDRHLSRLQSGRVESIETSDMHLEVVRALKEINSLLSTVAYPILTEHGDLLESRLVQQA